MEHENLPTCLRVGIEGHSSQRDQMLCGETAGVRAIRKLANASAFSIQDCAAD